jgi:hypothetical protein
MDATFARFIDCLATQKTRVKKAHPGADQSAVRRKAMIDAADGFDVDVQFSYPQWFADELEGMRPRVTRR